jgi:hypothetical protein
MARIDADQINHNRRICQDDVLDSPQNTVMEDSDADFPEMLFDRVPGDRVGFLPPNERKRSK